jgi:carbon storage regulator
MMKFSECVNYPDVKDDKVLVLKRKQGEVIIVGEDIEIHLIKVYSGRASIGIVAPDNVAVHRKEVAERIKSQLDDEPADK